MSATGQEQVKAHFGPVVHGFKFAKFNDINDFKSLVTNQTAAVILELIQGESGVQPANQSFIHQLVKYCNSADILVIIDEIQTGIGRTGKLFAYEHYNFTPDIITLAKGLGNGVPVGDMLGKSILSEAFDNGSHGTTFGGNRLAMVASLETLDVINNRQFLENVIIKSQYFIDQLHKAFTKNKHVVDMRGIGLMIGIETTKNIHDIVEASKEKGLIILTAGTNVIRLLPPLTITKAQIDKGIKILNDII